MLLLRQQLSLDAYIRSLRPAAWFRAGQGQTVTGAGVSQWDDISGNARHLKQGTDANRPVSLLHEGTNYLYLPGVAGNYASTPDSAANSITGDIDIRVRVSLDDWTPASNMAFVSKDTGAASGRSYRILQESGAGQRLQLLYTSDGSTVTGRIATATAAHGISDGETWWLRVTYASATGKVNFYKSADGVTWTAIGSEVSITAGAIADTTAILEIGSNQSGAATNLGPAKVYRAIIKNGIDGPTVVDFNAADATNEAASFASSTTGETWTVNKTGAKPAQIVGRSSLLFDGAAHFLKCDAFTLNQPTTVLMVVKQVSWTAGEYFFDGNSNTTGIIIHAGTTPEIRINAGATVAGNTGLAVGAVGVAAATFNGASSSLKINRNAATTGNAGANNMGGFTLGARADGLIFFSHIQVYETVIFPIAPSTAQLDRLVAGLMARHGVA